MANEPSLTIYQQNIELMYSTQTQNVSQRTATFLTHITKPLHEPAPFSSKPTNHPNPLFKAWKPPPTKWAEWVDHLAARYGAVWLKSGIFDSIMSSIYEIPCNHNLVSKLSHFWTPKTNTFVFEWGEATVTLEDVMILGGYSVLGDSVNSVSSVDLNSDFAEKVEVVSKFRKELVRSKAKKASHYKWIELFMRKENEHEHGHDIEHIAFLSLWLSRFVFPSGDQDSVGKHVIPIAVRLSQGVRLALGPAVLGYLYDNLTKLKSNSCINLLGSFQLVQIWGYERFPTIGPETPNELRPGEPRLARWHMLQTDVTDISFENMIWRPYALDLQNWKQPLYYQDSEQILCDSLTLDDDMRSFACIITPCELNGLGCKAKYRPHRVAMQFGFDQDIPGDLFSYKSSKFVKFLVPSRSFGPGVTKRYHDWWKDVDQMDTQNDQDSSLGESKKFEQVVCDKKFECVDLTLDDGLDDILVSLKKICNATKRKIDSLKESYVGVSQSTKKNLGTEIGKDGIDVIIID